MVVLALVYGCVGMPSVAGGEQGAEGARRVARGLLEKERGGGGKAVMTTWPAFYSGVEAWGTGSEEEGCVCVCGGGGCTAAAEESGTGRQQDPAVIVLGRGGCGGGVRCRATHEQRIESDGEGCHVGHGHSVGQRGMG
jgi:hypothetical protein